MNKIPLCIPEIGPEELKAVSEALTSGWLTHGPKNTEFEKAFAAYIGAREAVSMNSCTSALHLVVEALGITGEVLVPSFTFVASANAIRRAGATPVFVDVEYATGNVDPKAVEASIGPRTEALMIVHYAGQTCRMDRLTSIAKKHKLALIEDSAETLGGTWKGRQAGSFGAAACFSFFPTKNLTTGEGGMVTTNDPALAQKIRTVVAHGISKDLHLRSTDARPWYRAATVAGMNLRMTNFQAALGLAQLAKLDRMNEARGRHAARLSKALAGIEELDLPVARPECRHAWQMYTVKVKGADRDRFVQRLRERGVEASVHFDPPAHLQPAYRHKRFRRGPLDVTERLSRSIVTLPMFPGLTDEQVDRVAQAVRKEIRECRI